MYPDRTETGSGKSRKKQLFLPDSKSVERQDQNPDNGGTGSQGLRETPNVPVSNSDTTASSGSGTPHNNLQPYLVLNYIVKT